MSKKNIDDTAPLGYEAYIARTRLEAWERKSHAPTPSVGDEYDDDDQRGFADFCARALWVIVVGILIYCCLLVITL
jgi:hypothetical protein